MKSTIRVLGPLREDWLRTAQNRVKQGPIWGPDRPTYTNEKPANHAVFNSITNNAAVGDERAFVRIAEKGSGGKLMNRGELEAGKEYVVAIYYHNDASSSCNGRESNFIGIAKNVRVVTAFPKRLKTGESGIITGKITANGTDPQAVWAGACVTAKQDIDLVYLDGSAKIYNAGNANGKKLSQKIFTDSGTLIGFDELDGVLPGCEEHSGQVTYIIQTKVVEKAGPASESESVKQGAKSESV